MFLKFNQSMISFTKCNNYGTLTSPQTQGKTVKA